MTEEITNKLNVFNSTFSRGVTAITQKQYKKAGDAINLSVGMLIELLAELEKLHDRADSTN